MHSTSQLKLQCIRSNSQSEKVEKLDQRQRRCSDEQAQQPARLSKEIHECEGLVASLTDEFVVLEPEIEMNFVCVSESCENHESPCQIASNFQLTIRLSKSFE
jgi:hypothetical protein